MRSLHSVMSLVLLALAAGPLRGEDKLALRERAAVGEQAALRLDMQLKGTLSIKSGEKTIRYELQARAEHAFPERVLAVDKDGNPTRVARYYDSAAAEITVHGNKNERKLRPERRLVVAQRAKEGTVTYAPSGPLTREELELIGEHFDVLAVAGLLPGDEAAVGGQWHVTVPVLQTLAGVEGVLSEQIVCKLEAVQGDEARIRVAGKLEGLHHGAEVKCVIDGDLRFDTRMSHWTKLTWTQKDERTAGPVSPATVTETTTTVTRDAGVRSEQLADAVIAELPAEPNAAQLLLVYRDPKERFHLHHDRTWHLVTQNDQFAILRFLERGELLGQLNITPHTQARPGQHIAVEEFQKRVHEAPDFRVDQLLQAGEVPADPGHWAYRVSITGQAGDLQVLQNHFAVAGPDGRQVFLTFTTETPLADRFGARDLAIVGTVVFPGGR